VPTAGQPEGVVAPSLSTAQNQSSLLFETILLSSTSLHLSSIASVLSIAQIATPHRSVLISSVASCPCPPSSHSSLTNFASMAPSSSNTGAEMHSQRTRSKSDADIDYSSQGKSAFISIMLVMFQAVIRRTLDLSSQSPLRWVLISTTRLLSLNPCPCLLTTRLPRGLRVFVIRKIHLPFINLHFHLPCFSFFSSNIHTSLLFYWSQYHANHCTSL
jgi:hypothetical protein